MDNLKAIILDGIDWLVCKVVGHDHDCTLSPHLCLRCGRLFR